MPLVDNSLYILLFLHGNGTVPSMFHWALYAHLEGTKGIKYHIKTMGSGWMADHSQISDVAKSFLLVGILRIAKITVEHRATIAQVVETHDKTINNGTTTCSTYVLAVLADLRALGILNCSDIPTLKLEALAFGNKFQESARNNEQPRPIEDSVKCTI